MTDRMWHPLVKQFLDGERELGSLPAALQGEAEDARRMVLGAVDRQAVTLPADLDARVMAAVRTSAHSPWARTWRWLAAPTIPRWALLVPVAAAALVLLFAPTKPDTASEPQASMASRRDSVYVRFELFAPRASRVALAGTFNRWDPVATPLVRVGSDGMWTVTLALPPGQHQYGFIVDGQRWITDPAAPAVDDGFGRRNSVVSVNTVNGRIL